MILLPQPPGSSQRLCIVAPLLTAAAVSTLASKLHMQTAMSGRSLLGPASFSKCRYERHQGQGVSRNLVLAHSSGSSTSVLQVLFEVDVDKLGCVTSHAHASMHDVHRLLLLGGYTTLVVPTIEVLLEV